MVPEIEIKENYYAISDCEKYVSCITRTKEKKNGTGIFPKGKMPMIIIPCICWFR